MKYSPHSDATSSASCTRHTLFSFINSCYKITGLQYRSSIPSLRNNASYTPNSTSEKKRVRRFSKTQEASPKSKKFQFKWHTVCDECRSSTNDFGRLPFGRNSQTTKVFATCVLLVSQPPSAMREARSGYGRTAPVAVFNDHNARHNDYYKRNSPFSAIAKTYAMSKDLHRRRQKCVRKQ